MALKLYLFVFVYHNHYASRKSYFLILQKQVCTFEIHDLLRSI
jgi:hypothetical protein